MTSWAFSDDVLLRNWKYYLQGLPYTRLVTTVANDANQIQNMSGFCRDLAILASG